MLWLTVLFLISTALSFRMPSKYSLERRLPTLENLIYGEYNFFYRNTRDAGEEEAPKHEKPRPLRFG